MNEKKAEPLKQWVDCWPRDRFDEIHMKAYKAFDTAGSIRIQKVLYNKAEQMVSVIFLSAFPIEWLHEEMRDEIKRLAREKVLEVDLKSKQMSML